jgi:nitronate monooxygenase
MAEEMRTARFDTPLMRLFGLRQPILCGGLMWLSDPGYVAASARAGCLGFLTSRSFETTHAFAHAIDACQAQAGNAPVGVNLTVSGQAGMNARLADDLATALRAGVRHFETAGQAPGDLIGAIHEGGGIVLHKCASVRHAVSAQRAGADAVAIVGMEEGGHPGANELPTFVLGALAREQLRIPFALGGGIGCGAQIAAALLLGADAVVMGSRFLVAEEVWAHADYKRHIVGCDAHATTTVLRRFGKTWRVLANDAAREVQRREQAGIDDIREYTDLIRGTLARDHAYTMGDWNRGMLSAGPAIAFARTQESVARIVERLMAEASEAMARFDTVRRR